MKLTYAQIQGCGPGIHHPALRPDTTRVFKRVLSSSLRRLAVTCCLIWVGWWKTSATSLAEPLVLVSEGAKDPPPALGHEEDKVRGLLHVQGDVAQCYL